MLFGLGSGAAQTEQQNSSSCFKIYSEKATKWGLEQLDIQPWDKRGGEMGVRGGVRFPRTPTSLAICRREVYLQIYNKGAKNEEKSCDQWIW